MIFIVFVQYRTLQAQIPNFEALEIDAHRSWEKGYFHPDRYLAVKQWKTFRFLW